VSHDSNAIPIDGRLQNFVRKKARQIIARTGRTLEDPRDLEQEIWLRLVPRLPRYDPTQGKPGAFIRVVGQRIALNLIRERCAQKRDRGGEQSLDVAVPTHDGSLANLGQDLSQEDHDRRLGKKSRTDQELCQLLLDLEEQLAQMPPLRRELAELLKQVSLSAAARKLGRSVGKMRISVSLILRHFEEVGLRDYL
jgi:DNA-directed RNA polymerase specialized sigma24 family protein